MMTASEIITKLKTDCLHYRGDRPCAPHTTSGVFCQCEEYLPSRGQGVIVKLGAAGDVLRTTPLLRAIKTHLPQMRIPFITHSPELVPTAAAVMERLRSQHWDFCWNLDKDLEACFIASAVNANLRKGFGLRDGIALS